MIGEEEKLKWYLATWSPNIKFGKKSEKLNNLYVAIDHPGDNNSSILLNHLISNIKPSIKEENRNAISKFLKSKAKFKS